MRIAGSAYLWRANHVFLGGYKLANGVVELASLPTIDALLLSCIPVESLDSDQQRSWDVRRRRMAGRTWGTSFVKLHMLHLHLCP